jgi:hypothetical protein
LNRRGQLVGRRIEYKERLVAELVEGRATLRETAREFLEMNRPNPGLMEVVRRAHVGKSDEESTCRNVIEYVAMRLRAEPQRQREVVGRLNAELDQMLADEGTPRLD